VVAVDQFDDRIRTPFEAEQAVGFTSVGWILEQTDAHTAGFAVDQMRRLALSLERERRARGTRRFTLTSVKPDGGASQMTLDLARALVDIGVRAIAVELNAFKPDARYKRSPDTGVGIVDVLAGTCTVVEAIVPGDARLPDRLPIGEIGEGRHLSIGSSFFDLLHELGECYDVLLLDTPPILLSADAELFSGLADAALLVIGAESVSVGEVRRATKLLERLAPPVVGFLVNRVRVFSAGGYFSDLLKEYETGERQDSAGFLAHWLWGDANKAPTVVRTTQWQSVRHGTDGARDARRDEQYL
jgi:Mrp family chromosome partitioning ATPase